MTDQTTVHREALTRNEKLLEPVKVLDHGFVRLVDWMGDDQRVADSARVSYQQGTKSVRSDAGLIDYLVRHRHTSPIEQVVFTFHVKMPIYIARQWIRHRTASTNEVSARYSELPREFHVPEVWRMQSGRNKQVSEGTLNEWSNKSMFDQTARVNEHAYETYEYSLRLGVSREMARINLPVSIYTELYWTINAHNLLHFLRLRLHEHAQQEIREYAEAIVNLIRAVIPATVAAYEEHHVHGINLSRTEVEVLRTLLGADGDTPVSAATDNMLTYARDVLRPTRLRELLEKLGMGEE